jgi:hypothetical protein
MTIDLRGSAHREVSARWYDPRTGTWRDGPRVRPERITVTTPDARDWVLLVRSAASASGETER